MYASLKYHAQTALAALLVTIPSYACAQLINPGVGAAPDLSAYARTSDVAATYAPISSLSGYVQSVNTVPPVAGDVTVPTYTDTQARAAVASVGYALSTGVAAFVNNGAYLTVASLLSSFPCGTSTIGQYSRVSDLWGSVRTVMVCEYDGSSYYWRPQRTDYAVNNAATTGAMSLTPLVNAPVQYLTGTLTGNMTITPSTSNVWPGATFTLINKGILGLFGINISGLTGGTLALLAGGSRTLVYTAGGWQGF